MVAPESTPARRAALLLHGLPPAARDRVLARLSAGETTRLQPLLRELTELGLPASLCHELQKSPSSSVTPAAPGASARQRAEALGAAEVAQALKACSPATMATLLQMEEWPWKEAVLELAGELRRAELQRYVRGEAPVLPPALAEALCERLCLEAGARGSHPWTR